MSILDELRDELAKLAAGEQPNMMPYMSNAPKEPTAPATLEAVLAAQTKLDLELAALYREREPWLARQYEYVAQQRLPIVPVSAVAAEQERVATFVRGEIEKHLLSLPPLGFAPAISTNELKSVVALAIDKYRAEQELYGTPSAIAGVVEEVSPDGIARVRLMVGGSVFPDDKVTFTLTQEPSLPRPAPPPPEPPWVSSDADARTRTAEWQASVRERFERRVGAALVAGR